VFSGSTWPNKDIGYQKLKRQAGLFAFLESGSENERVSRAQLRKRSNYNG